jgi:hypothetical protein
MSARLSPDELRLRSLTEKQWQDTVTGLATRLGWRWYHSPDNRPVTARSGKRYVQDIKAGFPDLVLTRGPRLVFAELKRQGPAGKVSDEQHAWLLALAYAGAETYVWRPGDLTTVRTVLR